MDHIGNGTFHLSYFIIYRERGGENEGWWKRYIDREKEGWRERDGYVDPNRRN